MADSVNALTLFSSEKRVVMLFNNVSDGTGETAVAKVDISGLPGVPTKVRINQIEYSTFGMSVSILFDHDTDDRALVVQGDGCRDFRQWGGIHDPASAGGTGDILFTTNGATAGDTYSILLDLDLK